MFAYIHSSGPRDPPDPELYWTEYTDTAQIQSTVLYFVISTPEYADPGSDLSRNHQPPIQPILIGHWQKDSF